MSYPRSTKDLCFPDSGVVKSGSYPMLHSKHFSWGRVAGEGGFCNPTVGAVGGYHCSMVESIFPPALHQGARYVSIHHGRASKSKQRVKLLKK